MKRILNERWFTRLCKGTTKKMKKIQKSYQKGLTKNQTCGIIKV